MNTPDDFNRRLRAWVEPDSALVERIRQRALSRPASPRDWRFAAVSMTLATAVLLALSVLLWTRSARPAGIPFCIDVEGDVMTVRAGGQSWIVAGQSSGPVLPEGDIRLVLDGGNQ